MKEEAEMDTRWWSNQMIRRLGESGEMALRWAAAGMLAAEAQFRRVKGFRELPALAVALWRAVGLPEGEEAAIA